MADLTPNDPKVVIFPIKNAKTHSRPSYNKDYDHGAPPNNLWEKRHIVLLWTLATPFIGVFLIFVWHMIAPMPLLWLTANQYQCIESFFLGMSAIGIFLLLLKK